MHPLGGTGAPHANDAVFTAGQLPDLCVNIGPPGPRSVGKSGGCGEASERTLKSTWTVTESETVRVQTLGLSHSSCVTLDKIRRLSVDDLVGGMETFISACSRAAASAERGVCERCSRSAGRAASGHTGAGLWQVGSGWSRAQTDRGAVPKGTHTRATPLGQHGHPQSQRNTLKARQHSKGGVTGSAGRHRPGLRARPRRGRAG